MPNWKEVPLRDLFPFPNRTTAGAMLAARLQSYAHYQDTIVLALPRGGVPVAYAVARALRVPLDVLVVHKLGVPWQPELALGAIASGNVRVLYNEVLHELDLPTEVINAVTAREQRELERRERVYRDHRLVLEVHQRIVLLVDDDLATGATMRAAVRAARQQKTAHDRRCRSGRLEGSVR